jgi:hypothetical protein
LTSQIERELVTSNENHLLSPTGAFVITIITITIESLRTLLQGKKKPMERMSTETIDTGNSSKRSEAQHGLREAEEHKVKTAVEHGWAQIEQARPLETKWYL